MFFRNGTGVQTEIEALLTASRLNAYKAAVGPSLENVLQLYVWNAALSGAFLPVIGMVEVVLRNSFDARLRAAFTAEWYDDPGFRAIDPRLVSNVDRAKSYIAPTIASGMPLSSTRVVAELSLNFWVSMMRPAYSRSLWPALKPALPKYTRRAKAIETFEPIVAFRNRVAHHEVIFNRHPEQMYQRLIACASMLSENLASWIEHHARVRELLAKGPVPPRCLF